MLLKLCPNVTHIEIFQLPITNLVLDQLCDDINSCKCRLEKIIIGSWHRHSDDLSFCYPFPGCDTWSDVIEKCNDYQDRYNSIYQYFVRVIEKRDVPESGGCVSGLEISRTTDKELGQYLYDACTRNDHISVHCILANNQKLVRKARNLETNVTGFFVACSRGYYEVAYELLQTMEVEIDERNNNGICALYIATMEEHGDIVRLLIDCEADVNVQTKTGATALYNAVRTENEIIVQYLLNAMADVNLFLLENHASPLICACMKRNHSIVLQLLQEPKTGHADMIPTPNPTLMVNATNIDGQSALWISSSVGDEQIVQTLMNHSHVMAAEGMFDVLNVNQRDNKQQTPLFIASKNGHCGTAKILIENNADVNIVDENGRIPLWIASNVGHLEVCRSLLSSPAINIFHQDANGETALFTACENNRPQIIHELFHASGLINDNNVERKYDNEVVNDGDEEDDDDDDYKRIILPLFNPRPQSLPMLEPEETEKIIHHLMTANNMGCTPLWIATQRGHIACIEVLASYGTHLNEYNEIEGTTPLFIACMNGNQTCVDFFMKTIANINLPRFRDQSTPIMIAVYNGFTDIVFLLLDNGADIMQTNSCGLNLFTCAAVSGHLLLMRIIFGRLSNLQMYTAIEVQDFVNANENVYGYTALHLAYLSANEEMIAYLINDVLVDTSKVDLTFECASDYKDRYNYNDQLWELYGCFQVPPHSSVLDDDMVEEPYSEYDFI